MATYELRAPYFKGAAGTHYLEYNGEKIALEVDDRGRFEWTPKSVPIGIFARMIGKLGRGN